MVLVSRRSSHFLVVAQQEHSRRVSNSTLSFFREILQCHRFFLAEYFLSTNSFNADEV